MVTENKPQELHAVGACTTQQGTSSCSAKVKDLTFDLIRKCESTGLTIDAIITDMGPGNQGLWRECGITAIKLGKISVSCEHPCASRSDRELYFLADAPHILKNLRGHLVRGQHLIIPDKIVQKPNLPSNEVSINYVREVAQRDGTSELKLAPRLKERHLDPSHYKNMSVASALAVKNHSTRSAIRALVKGQMSSVTITTAWFLETVFKWLRLLSSRKMSPAMSEINVVLDLFKRLTIQGPGKKPLWKPVQMVS
ncbi:hypothetical protein HPB47_028161 [Ixodes persulcatus]|uniref:Uncharacterized protein n=1 Tax=Ixodes persulcatus TaxID=34615 RepID=A0AC60PVE4_IXOPE|nr:hypothetical protein HPB47_028161 [Ixodes persulcatus]